MAAVVEEMTGEPGLLLKLFKVKTIDLSNLK